MPLDLPINYANERLPMVSDELILWLKEVFPDRMPDETDMSDIRFKQGQLSVVKTLTSINADQ